MPFRRGAKRACAEYPYPYRPTNPQRSTVHMEPFFTSLFHHSSHLTSCYYHRYLHQRSLRPTWRPKLRGKPRSSRAGRTHIPDGQAASGIPQTGASRRASASTLTRMGAMRRRCDITESCTKHERVGKTVFAEIQDTLGRDRKGEGARNSGVRIGASVGAQS